MIGDRARSRPAPVQGSAALRGRLWRAVILETERILVARDLSLAELLELEATLDRIRRALFDG